MVEDSITRVGLNPCCAVTDWLMIRDPIRWAPQNAQSPPGLKYRSDTRKVP